MPRPSGPPVGGDQIDIPPPRPAATPDPQALESWERGAGYAAAAFTLVAGLFVWVPELGHPHVKGALYSPTIGLVVAVAGAAILVAATAWNKRLALGFASLIIGEFGPWGNLVPLGFPLLALAIWEVLRYTRLSRAAQGPRRAAAQRAREERAAARAASRGRSPGGRRNDTSPFPPPSKRYTPPRTPASRSRRIAARRAADANRSR